MSAFLEAAQSTPNGKFVKLKDEGDTLTMEVSGYTERQQREYNPTPGAQGDPIFDKRGNPVMEQLVKGLDYGAESEEEADVVLPVSKFQMKKAIGEALQKAGASDLQAGGVLTVTCEGFGVARGGGYPPKIFSAEYYLPEPAKSPWNGED